MTQKFSKLFIFSFALGLLFVSCSDNDNEPQKPKGDYDNGILILNEGNFGQPNASVSFTNTNDFEVENEIFQTVNSTTLGDVAQSLGLYHDYAFIVLNNSNKVEVVNRYTFESVATLTEGISLPRYVAFENDKAYISNSGTSTVAVYDANTFAFKSTIDLGKTVNQVIAEDGKVYVQNASFGTGKEITVIDANTDEVVKTIDLGENYNELAEGDDMIYATADSGLIKIDLNSNEVAGTIAYGTDVAKGNKIEVENGMIYFVSGKSIYEVMPTATEVINPPLIEVSTSATWDAGYGFGVEDGLIYYAIANGFTAPSTIYVYNEAGQKVQEITAGMGTNSFYEND